MHAPKEAAMAAVVHGWDGRGEYHPVEVRFALGQTLGTFYTQVLNQVYVARFLGQHDGR